MEHPAEIHARAVRRAYRAGYEEAERYAEERIREHVESFGGAKGGGGRTSGGGAGRDSVHIFRGKAWDRTLRDIVRAFYRANKAAIKGINRRMAEAFADGANHAAFGFARGGGGKTAGGGAGRTPQEPLPYTVKVVQALVKAGAIALALKELSEAKDKRFTRKRAQSAAVSEALMDDDPEEMPRRIARRLGHSMMGAMDATAQAMLYGAYDSGVYEAGLDAERDGYEVDKTWLGIPDNRIRASHRHLHNTTIPMSEVFHGYHGVLRFPHDPKAPAAEIYRCRCRMAVHPAGKAPKGFDGLLMPRERAEYQKWRDAAIRKAGADLIQMHKRRRRSGKVR